jgi:DNA replication protein DnaC
MRWSTFCSALKSLKGSLLTLLRAGPGCPLRIFPYTAPLEGSYEACSQSPTCGNLKFLKLSAMLAELEASIRQAKEGTPGYGEFILKLTEIEVAARMENGRKRRIKEAKFPLLKPIESFDFGEAPDLDSRSVFELIRFRCSIRSRALVGLT